MLLLSDAGQVLQGVVMRSACPAAWLSRVVQRLLSVLPVYGQLCMHQALVPCPGENVGVE